MQRATSGKFDQHFPATLGSQLGVLRLKIDDTIDMRLHIWDTSGQEKYMSLTRQYYKGAHAVFLTYSTCNLNSFHKIEFWHQEVLKESDPSILCFLVGTQNDKVNERKVSLEMAYKVCKERELSYFMETSAKTGENVDEMFCQLGKMLYKE